MSKPSEEKTANTPRNLGSPTQLAQHVTYVVVVHGIGEQRKNETATSVVNRFAEARRRPDPHDNRDVLTLGLASGQTGFSKVPGSEQPWMEFDGIPASPLCVLPTEPFLGEPSTSGDCLRFVDLCWSDLMQDSIKHVGQEADVWAKGLLGRLLRRHEAAEHAKNVEAQVPLWVRRVLYLLADTLVLVRFAMNFRFKEMKELVFVKFLGDVQLYGEYSRCRGRAVRRFHEIMSKVEAEHRAQEDRSRKARYVIIAHSLGSIMALDALLYARATCRVRHGLDSDWHFPGYLRNDNKGRKWPEGALAFLDTDWVKGVKSFVTLGSPIDKYLTIWWLNYSYLRTCADRLKAGNRIAHFNYCDELDPVGHNLDVVRGTACYQALFECREDIVFNRYAIPGGAHNKYWTDQGLFRRILHRAVDDLDVSGVKPPRWFRPKVYCWLLLWLYSLVPLFVVLGTYASLSFAFQTQGWRTAAVAAAVFSFLAYSGRRLIDLSIWWRQMQRQKAGTFWNRNRATQRRVRESAAWVFRVLITVVPFAWGALAMWAFQPFDPTTLPDSIIAGPHERLAVVLIVAIVVVWLLLSRRLPGAYRTSATGDGRLRSTAEAMALLLVFVAVIGLANFLAWVPNDALGQMALVASLATVAYGYRLYRFIIVKCVLRHAGRREPGNGALDDP